MSLRINLEQGKIDQVSFLLEKLVKFEHDLCVKLQHLMEPVLHALQQPNVFPHRNDVLVDEEVEETGDLLKEIHGDPIFDVYNDEDLIYDKESDINFIGIQEVDDINLGSMEHVHVIDDSCMVMEDTCLDTACNFLLKDHQQVKSTPSDCVVSKNSFSPGKESLYEKRYVDHVVKIYNGIERDKKQLYEEEIYIQCYGDLTFAIYDEDVEPPDRELLSICCLGIHWYNGLISKCINVSYMTNEKGADTCVCNSTMGFMIYVCGHGDSITICPYSQSEVGNRGVYLNYLLDPIQWCLDDEAVNTNKKHIDLCVASRKVLILFSRELPWKYYKTCNSMNLLLLMCEEITQEACEGRKNIMCLHGRVVLCLQVELITTSWVQVSLSLRHVHCVMRLQFGLRVTIESSSDMFLDDFLLDGISTNTHQFPSCTQFSLFQLKPFSIHPWFILQAGRHSQDVVKIFETTLPDVANFPQGHLFDLITGESRFLARGDYAINVKWGGFMNIVVVSVCGSKVKLVMDGASYVFCGYLGCVLGWRFCGRRRVDLITHLRLSIRWVGSSGKRKWNVFVSVSKELRNVACDNFKIRRVVVMRTTVLRVLGITLFLVDVRCPMEKPSLITWWDLPLLPFVPSDNISQNFPTASDNEASNISSVNATKSSSGYNKVDGEETINSIFSCCAEGVTSVARDARVCLTIQEKIIILHSMIDFFEKIIIFDTVFDEKVSQHHLIFCPFHRKMILLDMECTAFDFIGKEKFTLFWPSGASALCMSPLLLITIRLVMSFPTMSIGFHSGVSKQKIRDVCSPQLWCKASVKDTYWSSVSCVGSKQLFVVFTSTIVERETPPSCNYVSSKAVRVKVILEHLSLNVVEFVFQLILFNGANFQSSFFHNLLTRKTILIYI
ncbi:hypothetical protein Bca4012_037707 [Brassica carinata]